jgi:5'-methylthioadenosine nucleosidase
MIMSISNVVVAIAMEAEASPFVNHLKLQLDPSFFPTETPFRAFRGKHNNCNLTVITNGVDGVYGTGVDNVGTVPAAIATFLALQKLKADTDPADLLINAGTCGGFKRKGANIGDVFLTTATANHDRRIAIPGFTSYGIGKVESTSVERLANHLDAKLGICTTGNSLDYHELDSHHMLENDASVKDMEAAAIAWASEVWNTPHFGVKVVTDIVDGDKPSHEEFMENLGTAARSLQSTLPRVIDYVCDKTHDEL